MLSMPDPVVVGLWGLLSGSGLLVGAVAADLLSGRLTHRMIAAVMGVGGGVQFAVVAGGPLGDAIRSRTALPAIGALLLGAATFSGVNWLLSRRGAKDRKRCGECVQQPSESVLRGSGMAIAAGSVLDGIPEALLIGLSVTAGGTLGMGVIVGFFLANVPQGLSSAAGMKTAGRSRRYVYAIWIAVPLLIGLSAAIGNLTLGGGAAQAPAILAFAAGAVLAMLTETMIPEALDDAPPFIGLMTVIGFLVAYLIARP